MCDSPDFDLVISEDERWLDMLASSPLQLLRGRQRCG